ncbi:3'-5' exoribonuclease domain-containing protein [Bradyrhizobium elkanii]|uniref:3'-5' exoribonuclease domain-containing protein n=1 Tax=Bradyrhizobium elkanii TaxID=29448 RepID=UPI0021689014|nr:3'-5' exoribonuclease [Bradyrhizobium elkanii]MCS3690888.1 hypothetical protein [Bradyrhizobium elkanii]
MKIWFDTEFIEDGKTIDLISIGMVREDGAILYLENRECNFARASDWVKKNVLPYISSAEDVWRSRSEIAEAIIEFAGEKPEFWAYYADYDWVVLCQLYGTMMQLPTGWPMYCRDVKQLCDDLGNPKLPAQTGTEHHALADADWTRRAHSFLTNLQNRMASDAVSEGASQP